MKQFVTQEWVVTFLNTMLEIDRKAVSGLFLYRLGCNEELANHRTVQVREYSNGEYSVGFLGILNGLFGIDKDGWGPIAAIVDKQCGIIEEFRLVTPEDKNPTPK